MADELAAAVVVDPQSEGIAAEVHALGGELGRGLADRDGCHERSELPLRPLAEELPAAGEGAFAEVDEHPPGHVVGAREDAPGGVHVVVLVDPDRRRAFLERRVRDGHVPAGDRGRMARPARGHAGLLQYPLGHEVLPGLAAHGFDDLARGDIEHIVVGVGAAEARCRPDEAEAADDLAPRVARLRPE